MSFFIASPSVFDDNLWFSPISIFCTNFEKYLFSLSLNSAFSFPFTCFFSPRLLTVFGLGLGCWHCMFWFWILEGSNVATVVWGEKSIWEQFGNWYWGWASGQQRCLGLWIGFQFQGYIWIVARVMGIWVWMYISSNFSVFWVDHFRFVRCLDSLHGALVRYAG